MRELAQRAKKHRFEKTNKFPRVSRGMQIISLVVMEFSEADPDLIEFLNDFYAKLISARSGLLEIFHFGDFYGNFIKNIFLLFFLPDFQQSVKNVNRQCKVRRTLKTSNSKVIASSLLLVLVLSAICDVTGESFRMSSAVPLI